MVLGGAVGVSDVFGVWGRIRLCLVAAFFALRCFLAGRIDRFALAFARAVLWTRFVRALITRMDWPVRAENATACRTMVPLPERREPSIVRMRVIEQSGLTHTRRI